ncbi:MAG: DUF4350 domain-containing protein [Lysobacterales bacterium]
MNRRALTVAALSAVLIVAALVAWWALFERVESEITLPPRGAARSNPLYALGLAIGGQGLTVRHHRGFDRLQPDQNDLVLIHAAGAGLNDRQVEDLLYWVEQGGHLVMALPNAGSESGDRLSAALGLDLLPHFSCLDWHWPGEDTAPSLCSERRFLANEDASLQFLWTWGNAEDGYVFGRAGYGAGEVFIAASLNFLVNAELDQPGNAALAWQVLAPSLEHARLGQVHLVHASPMPSLWYLLIRHGWPILVPLLLALLAFAAARSQRFGPLLPARLAPRRALLEHVQAAGEFAFRRGHGDTLHGAVLRRFEAEIERRVPGFAELPEAERVRALSERHQIAQGSIRAALHTPDQRRADSFFHAIKTLMQLRTRP